MSWSAKVLVANIGIHVAAALVIWLAVGRFGSDQGAGNASWPILVMTAIQIVLNVFAGFRALNVRDAAYAQPFFLSALVLPLVGFSTCSLSL